MVVIKTAFTCFVLDTLEVKMKQKILKLVAIATTILLISFVMPISAVNGSENEIANSESSDMVIQNQQRSVNEWDINEVIELKNYLMGYDNTYSEMFDINNDGSINVFDLIILRRIVSENNQNNNITAEGDGWYIKGSTLYISKIYYGVVSIAGLNKYICDTPWNEYSEQVKSIIVDGEMVYKSYGETDSPNPDSEEATMSAGLFVNNSSVESITFKHLNLDKIKDMSWWFAACKSLKSVDLSGINASKVISFDSMFSCCASLTSINLNSLNISSLKSMSSMFYSCESLSKLRMEKCNVTNVDDFSHMFQGCSSLVNVNLSGWKIENDCVDSMFVDCKSLKNVNIGSVIYQNNSDTNSDADWTACYMFDDNNSISSYMFADNWDIDYETFGAPFTAIDHYYPGVITIGKENVFYAIITYDQLVPNWYEDWNAKCFKGFDGTMIVDSDYVDIYLSIDDNYANEPSDDEIIGTVVDIIVDNLVLEDEGEQRKVNDAINEERASEVFALCLSLLEKVHEILSR